MFFPIKKGILKNVEGDISDRNRIGFPNSDTATYFNDFYEFPFHANAPWIITKTQAGATHLVADEPCGLLRLSNTATNNDLLSVQQRGQKFTPAAGRLLTFMSRIKVSDVVATGIRVGLMGTDTTPFTTSSFIGFEKNDFDSLLDFSSTKSTIEFDRVNALATMANNTFVDIGFKVFGTSKIEYWIDQRLAGSVSPTNIATDPLHITFSIITADNNVKILSVDYVYVNQERL